MAKQQMPASGLELFGEVSDLAGGAGILIFALAPFALPGLALAALGTRRHRNTAALGRAAVPFPVEIDHQAALAPRRAGRASWR